LENLTVVAEDFAIPEDMESQMLDKYRKIQRGLIEARKLSPNFWMKVDSDDCVSNRVAAFVGNHSESPGWLITKGWIHSEGKSAAFLERRHFFQLCGTSSIISWRKFGDMPRSMDEPLSKFPFLNTSHVELDRLAERCGAPFDSLRFAGAIYCTATGENWSGFGGVTEFRSKKWFLRRLFHTHHMSGAIRREFGYYPLAS
jgi:hypothetical protein